MQGFIPKLLNLRFPKLKTDQMDLTTHAGSNDGAYTICAYVSINNLLMERGQRITNVAAEVTGMLEVRTSFDF